MKEGNSLIINLFLLYYSALFLTTAFDKIIDFKGSIIDIQNYNILPKFLIKPFIFIMILIHIFLSYNLLFSRMVKFSLILAGITILIYTIAVFINLIKGNKVACGCKGMAGNKIISQETILRNIVLIVGICIIYWFKPEEFRPIFVFYLLVYIEIYILFLLYKEVPILKKNGVSNW
jgi:hypothetical protein